MLDKMVRWIFLMLVVIICLSFWLCISVLSAEANNFVPRTEKQVEKLAMAIYKAEGGSKSRFPFGIKSISCDGYEECKRICMNTVRNNVKRWEKARENGDKRDYLTFLWHRYCPPNLHALNSHWKNNVEWFLGR